MNIHNRCLFSGTTASDTHFQAYLLDGLKRWNDDRMHQQSDKPSTISYSGLERYAVNELSQSVLNERLIPEFQPPRKYTGEKIGVEYLLSQTGKVLQDIISSTDTDNAALARQEEAEAATEEEEEDQDEGFGDDPEDDPTLPSLEPEELRPPQQQTGQRAPVERKQSTGQRDPVERQQSTGQRDPVERQQSTGQRDPVERQQSKGQRIPAAGQQSSSVSRAKSTPQASSSVTPARPASSGGKRPARFRSNSPDSSDSEASRDPEWVPDDDNGANDDDDDDDGLGVSIPLQCLFYWLQCHYRNKSITHPTGSSLVERQDWRARGWGFKTYLLHFVSLSKTH